MRSWIGLGAVVGVAVALGGCPPTDTKSGEHSGTADAEVWTDEASGLTWEVPAQESQTWQAASDRCDGLTAAGHDDWRLPTISELRTLIVDCPLTEPGGSCEVTDACADGSTCRGDDCGGCGYVPDACYRAPALTGNCGFTWSSTLDTNDPDQAWGVGFDGAQIAQGLRANVNAARCVR